jgi:hypothetical protein
VAGPEKQRIRDILANPVEGLNAEVKRWFDLDTPHGTSKLVKACFALRNRNGGYLVIGFDNASGKPVTDQRPTSIRDAFHVDKVQALISRYASEAFEVELHYENHDGTEFPVVQVPSGVQAPVAVKTDLVGSDAKSSLRKGDVYFRTLASNGTASTSVARPNDWKDLVEICFDNREADFGRFFRRQLAAADVRALIDALQSLAGPAQQPSLSLAELTSADLAEGEQRLAEALAKRTLAEDEKALLKFGTWSVALRFEPLLQGKVADQDFMSTLGSSNPRYTGWPMWLDSRGFRNQGDRPYIREGGWEALIVGAHAHADFMRMDPAGKFYLRRVLQDDLTDKVTPMTVLDPSLMLYRVGEVIGVALAFGKALGFDQEGTRLGFAFKWTGIANRNLVRWADTFRDSVAYDPSHEDVITTFTEVPLDTAPQAIAPFVDSATRQLFAAFGGHRVPLSHIEDRVTQLINRQW